MPFLKKKKSLMFPDITVNNDPDNKKQLSSKV